MRRKNLLEAFKESQPAPPAAPGSLGPPAASGPAAPPPSLSAAHAPRELASASSAPLFDSVAATSPDRRPLPIAALAAIGLVLAFVLGFLVGRASDGEAQAGETDLTAAVRPPPVVQPRAFQTPPAAGSAPATTAAGERLEDSALFDPANLWTVIVASYNKSYEELAWATHEHLRDAGIAVFPPVVSRNLVIVVVGAAPTYGELEKTEAAVKALTRDGKKAYVDAYRARIDTLIPRSPSGETQKGSSKQ